MFPFEKNAAICSSNLLKIVTRFTLSTVTASAYSKYLFVRINEIFMRLEGISLKSKTFS